MSLLKVKSDAEISREVMEGWVCVDCKVESESSVHRVSEPAEETSDLTWVESESPVHRLSQPAGETLHDILATG